MKRIGLGASMLLIGLFSFCQTPQIMHKMFGGTKSNFVQTMQDSDAVIRQTNFGLPPTIYVKKAVIDSIIALNDSTVIVVTSHKVVEDFESFSLVYSEEDSSFVCSNSMVQKSLTYDKTGDWQPGRDTLINHGVFDAKQTCNDIRSRLSYEFGVRMSIGHEIVFIGFDCSKAADKKKRKNIVPPFWFSSPFDPNSWMIVVALFSLVYFVVLRKRKAVLSF